MPKVQVVIDATAVDDPYLRYHGKAVDGTLNTSFWDTQPENNIGKATSVFHHEQTIDLRPGRHTIEYGVSSYKGYWSAKITVNGKEITSGDTTASKHLTGSFLLGPGFLLPVILPLQIRMLKIRMLTFPPVLGSLSHHSPSDGCIANIEVEYANGLKGSFASVDVWEVRCFLWSCYDTTWVGSRTADVSGKTSLPLQQGKTYHVRARAMGKQRDVYKKPTSCPYYIGIALPS
mgnify:CR=1 FL=1